MKSFKNLEIIIDSLGQSTDLSAIDEAIKEN